MNRLEIKKGTIYNYLTVIKEGEKIILPSGQSNRTITCQCECGEIKDVRLVHLTRNRITSCGCKFRSMDGKSTTKIGVLYRSIKWRCTKNYVDKHLYYEKGIRVCDEWLNDFSSFENWCLNNGYNSKLQIDREDNSKGYTPENCRFVSSKVNCNNRDNTLFVTFLDKRISLQLLLEDLKYPNKFATVYTRLKRGWKLEDALFKKPANNYSNRKSSPGQEPN